MFQNTESGFLHSEDQLGDRNVIFNNNKKNGTFKGSREKKEINNTIADPIVRTMGCGRNLKE